MDRIKYLLDEHVSYNLRKAVKKLDNDIVIRRIGDIDAPAVGTLDPVILFWCDINNFTLVTNNRKSMPEHLKNHLRAGGHIPGIFVLNPNLSMGEIAYELALIAGIAEAVEFTDQLRYLPIIK